MAITNNMVNVLFMKKVKKEYIARAAAIATSACVAAFPITSFIVSAVVAVISVQAIFIVSGVLTLLVTAIMSKNAYLLRDEEPEATEETIRTDEEVTASESANEA